MHIRKWLTVSCFLSCMIFTADPDDSSLSGCSPVMRPGETVNIQDEAALIIWDKNGKTEHFIRRANFKTDSENFGFLVPSPTQPDLGEVSDNIFTTVGKITEPELTFVTETHVEFGFGEYKTLATNAEAKHAIGEDVEVLHRQNVAGLEATVLRADDANALVAWLEKHEYQTRPALTEWLQWYVDHKWMITAFKLGKNNKAQVGLETKSVRMSFQSDRPFYPYREPEDMRMSAAQGTRGLRVFFLSDQRFEGTIGESGTWPGTTQWSSDISGKTEEIISQLNLVDANLQNSLTNARYLTEFQDNSYPRPGTDEVYFHPAQDQSTLKRPPVVMTSDRYVVIPGPWGIVVLPVVLVVGVFAIVRRVRKTE